MSRAILLPTFEIRPAVQEYEIQAGISGSNMIVFTVPQIQGWRNNIPVCQFPRDDGVFIVRTAEDARLEVLRDLALPKYCPQFHLVAAGNHQPAHARRGFTQCLQTGSDFAVA